MKKLRVPDELASLIKSLHPELKRKVRASLHFIQDDPESGKALREELLGLRSYRVGTFRIIYRIHRTVIEIVAIGPRTRIYEETFILLKKEHWTGP